jgi:hypothetical protein
LLLIRRRLQRVFSSANQKNNPPLFASVFSALPIHDTQDQKRIFCEDIPGDTLCVRHSF